MGRGAGQWSEKGELHELCTGSSKKQEEVWPRLERGDAEAMPGAGPWGCYRGWWRLPAASRNPGSVLCAERRPTLQAGDGRIVVDVRKISFGESIILFENGGKTY